MSGDDMGVNRGSSEEHLRAVDADEHPLVQGLLADIPQNGAQNQLLLVPEIMSMILGLLDLRSLKKVRLVCKSWLLEAQLFIQRRGVVVRLDGDETTFPTKLQKFSRAVQKKLPELPLPFQAIEMDANKADSSWLVEKLIMPLIGILSPPLVITRFIAGELGMKPFIQILHQYSPSLEYLKLPPFNPHQRYEAELIKSMLDPERHFPKLRHIFVDVKSVVFSLSIKHFAALVVGIVKASPGLETYESEQSQLVAYGDELASKVLLGLDIRNVKTLLLRDYNPNPAALQHFISYPFRGLENLKIIIRPGFPHPPINEPALIATLAKSGATLKRLDLLRYAHPENFAQFPVCPNVQELTLDGFPYSNNFLLDRFPSLQVLKCSWTKVDVLGASWMGLPPLFGLKTLILNCVELTRHGDVDLDEQLPLKFFEKFPDLERLRLSYSFVMDCCRVKARGHPTFSKILEGVKFLELLGNGVGWFEEAEDRHLFSSLNGIETLTLVKPNENLLLIPFKNMPSLKVLQFPWGACFNEKTLLEVTGGLERVGITNCCSFPRTGDPWSSKALDSFLSSAPNAKCGCKERKEMF